MTTAPTAAVDLLALFAAVESELADPATRAAYAAQEAALSAERAAWDAFQRAAGNRAKAHAAWKAAAEDVLVAARRVAAAAR